MPLGGWLARLGPDGMGEKTQKQKQQTGVETQAVPLSSSSH